MLVLIVISSSNRLAVCSDKQNAAQKVKQKSTVPEKWSSAHNQHMKKPSIQSPMPARDRSIGWNTRQKNAGFIFITPSVVMLVNAGSLEHLWMVTSRLQRRCFNIMAITFTVVLPTVSKTTLVNC